MELKISYETSENKFRDGWRVELEGRFAYLSPGEVLELLAAVMLSGDKLEDRLSWLKTESEHAYMNSIYEHYIKNFKLDNEHGFNVQ